MSSDVCRLCNSSNTKLTSSIKDEIIVNLIEFVPQLNVEVKNPKLPSLVCQLCYGKAKISYDFMLKIQQTQIALTKTKKSSNLKITNALSLSALEKVQRVGSISIKKVSTINESVIKVEENNDFLDELDMFNNYGEAGSSDDDYNEAKDVESDEEDEEDDDYVEDDTDDDDFEPNARKRRLNDGAAKGSPKKKSVGGGQKEKSSNEVEIIIDAPINYSCSKCKAKFTSFIDLSDHMKGRQCFDEVITCKTCNKVFKSKKNLYSHMQSHRPKEKYMCEVCAKEYNHQFDLESHMESVHHRVVKRDCVYRCTHCQEKFDCHLDLLEHVKEHQREKKEAPRLCEICAKVCVNLKAYQSHIVIHKEKKAHTCIHCGKGFAKAFLMAQHMHIHTGIKSFVCEICNKAYAKRDSLRTHKKRDHPNMN